MSASLAIITPPAAPAPAAEQSSSTDPSSAKFKWMAYTPAQREQIRFRLGVVEYIQKQAEHPINRSKSQTEIELAVVARYVLQGKTFTHRTLQRWRSEFLAAGLAGLADGRWNPKENRGVVNAGQYVEFFDAGRKLYLEPRCRSKKLCFDRARDRAIEDGWAIPSYRTFCRMLDEIPVKVVALHRTGERKYEATAGPYIERDYSTLRSNEIWQSDHHQFDCWVRYKGELVRPWITSWIDLRSAMVTGFEISAGGNSFTILRAFRRGGEQHGFPESVYIDNGKDYDSKLNQGVTKRQRQRGDKLDDAMPPMGLWPIMDTKAIHSIRWNAKAKRIERFHKTICERFTVEIPTYCGGSPEHRPHDVKDHLEEAPEMAEFGASFAAWLESDYQHKAHEGLDGQTPADVFAANLDTKRVIDADTLNFVCLPMAEVKVSRNGVKINGIGYGAFDTRMIVLEGKQVIVRVDPEKIGVAYISDSNDRFLFKCDSDQRLPANSNRELIGAAQARKKRFNRAVREYHDVRHTGLETTADAMWQVAAERRRAENEKKLANSTPQPMKIIQTHLADQMPKLMAAMKRATAEPTMGEGNTEMHIRPKKIDMNALARELAEEQSQANPFERRNKYA